MKVIDYKCEPQGYDYTISLELENNTFKHYCGVEFYKGRHIFKKDVVGLEFLEADSYIKNNVKYFL